MTGPSRSPSRRAARLAFLWSRIDTPLRACCSPERDHGDTAAVLTSPCDRCRARRPAPELGAGAPAGVLAGARCSAGARTGAAAFRGDDANAAAPGFRSSGAAGATRAGGEPWVMSTRVHGPYRAIRTLAGIGRRHRFAGPSPTLDVGTEPSSGLVGPTVPTRREHHVKRRATIRTSLRSSSAASRPGLLRCLWATRRRHRPSAGSSSGAPNRHLRR